MGTIIRRPRVLTPSRASLIVRNMRSKGARTMVVEGAGEEDDEGLDDDDEFPGDVGPERELGAALVEEAEKEGCKEDAEGVRATHEGDGDADEARAFDGVQDEPFRLAHDVVDRHRAREPARDQQSRPW